MSDLTSTSATSLLTSGGLTAADYTNEPTAIRDGGTAAKNAYSTGLAFEDVLMDQLTQAMTATTEDDGNGLGGSDSSDDTSGSDALSQSAYSSMIPQTLGQSLMSSGAGSALAMQIAAGIDPSLRNASTVTGTAAPSGTAAASGTSAAAGPATTPAGSTTTDAGGAGL